MKVYFIQAWADERPINMVGEGEIIEAGSYHTAFYRAAARVESELRRQGKRGIRQMSVRLTRK